MAKPSSSQSQRPSLKGPLDRSSRLEPEAESDSLFVTGGDEDRPWDPQNYDNEEGEEMLGWDASNENPNASFHQTFHDSGTVARPTQERQQQRQAQPENGVEDRLEPTQRLSQASQVQDQSQLGLLTKGAVAWHV